MRVIVAGGRDFDDYELLCKKLDYYLARYTNVEIVSGCAKGADKLGERYAKERGYKIKRFPADWNFYGKKGGFVRNEEMAEYADAAVIFWDGRSKGSQHMIDTSVSKCLLLRIVNY